MDAEHYFSSSPTSTQRLRRISVNLAGREFNVTTANGVFSPEHVDTGTRVLLDHVPTPPATGDVLDIGTGWGPMALTLSLLAPHTTVWAVDVNDRVLELVAKNAAELGLTNINAVHPEDVPEDITFATIWSNPPIRVGKAELHSILQTWLPKLQRGADAWLVVQRNLGSDSLQRWLNETLDETFTTTFAETSKGFRLLQVHRATESGTD
jgi:16S rRNA G1207 methylase RsmC